MYIFGTFYEFLGFRFFCVFCGAIFGAVFGSFACCQAWRIYYHDKKKKPLGKRSVCLSCGKQLRWFENIPIISWIIQGGRCRKCGKPIGKMEIVSELVGLVAFAVIGWKFSGEYLKLFYDCGFGLDWICRQYAEMGFLVVDMLLVSVFMVIALILAIYDAKWRELPIGLLIAGNFLAAVYVVLKIIQSEDLVQAGINILMAVGILAGIYYLLYFFSKEKLVGGGDWILCLAIGLMIGDWWLAIWVLFLANFLGAIVMLTMRKKKIGFAPFLVAAFVIVFGFSEAFLGLSV